MEECRLVLYGSLNSSLVYVLDNDPTGLFIVAVTQLSNLGDFARYLRIKTIFTPYKLAKAAHLAPLSSTRGNHPLTSR